MGLRLRLKASYDISGFHGEARVVLEALRRYGMIVADNGSNWFISGASDRRFRDGDLDQLGSVPAAPSRRSTPGRRYTAAERLRQAAPALSACRADACRGAGGTSGQTGVEAWP